ncbi:hypothetical protein QTP88_016582 [Uroleucon formosanum]
MNAGEKATVTPYSLLKILGGRIQNQNVGLSLLFSKAQALEAGSKEEVSKAYNAASISAKDAELNPVLDPPRIPTSDAGTQSPCWWEMSVPVRHVTKDRELAVVTWTEVVGRKTKIKTPETAAGPLTMTEGKAQTPSYSF